MSIYNSTKFQFFATTFAKSRFGVKNFFWLSLTLASLRYKNFEKMYYEVQICHLYIDQLFVEIRIFLPFSTFVQNATEPCNAFVLIITAEMSATFQVHFDTMNQLWVELVSRSFHIASICSNLFAPIVFWQHFKYSDVEDPKNSDAY